MTPTNINPADATAALLAWAEEHRCTVRLWAGPLRCVLPADHHPAAHVYRSDGVGDRDDQGGGA
jgi:hypothetical protein